MNISLYGIPNCDTVKKARSWLDARGIAYAFHDYKKEGADPAKLKAWVGKKGWEVILNRAGTTFRKLDDAQKQGLDAEKAIVLMLEHPSMIKRPVVEYPGGLLVGFKEAEWVAGTWVKGFLAALACLIAAPAMADAPVTVIAHRGASGERPEHTLASYELAIDSGADFIEPDLVSTKDGVLVARHENEISGTTDVAGHREFAARKATKTIDGQQVTGWFTEDFTLAELKTLHAKERLPDLRPDNTRFDGQFEIPTFAEILELVKFKEGEQGRRIGIEPELKHPSYFAKLGFALDDMVLKQLGDAGYSKKDDPVFIQCFEVGTLAKLSTRTELRLVQLLEAGTTPPDLPGVPIAAMVTPAGLAGIASYADAVGADMRLVLNPDGSPTSLVADAHAAGLQVHAWTLRRENAFLPGPLQIGDDPAGHGNYAALLKLIEAAGVDAVFTDNPADAIAAR